MSSDDEAITLRFKVVHIERRGHEVGPGVGYTVESGGADLPIGGAIMSTSAEHEQRVQRFAAELEEQLDLSSFAHDDGIVRATYDSPSDQEPALEWLIESPPEGVDEGAAP